MVISLLLLFKFKARFFLHCTFVLNRIPIINRKLINVFRLKEMSRLKEERMLIYKNYLPQNSKISFFLTTGSVYFKLVPIFYFILSEVTFWFWKLIIYFFMYFMQKKRLIFFRKYAIFLLPFYSFFFYLSSPENYGFKFKIMASEKNKLLTMKNIRDVNEIKV